MGGKGKGKHTFPTGHHLTVDSDLAFLDYNQRWASILNWFINTITYFNDVLFD